MSRLVRLGVAVVIAIAFLLGFGRQLMPSATLVSVPNGSLGAPSAADPAASHDQGGRTPTSSSAPVAIPSGNASIAVASSPLAKAADGYALSATVRTAAGAVGSAAVRFYEVVDLFGTREMYIGTATTDGTGVASLVYLPARTGAHEIVARTSAADKVDAAVARMTFESSVAAPVYRVEPAPLASFADRVPYGVGLIVLGVWALIAFALLATARGVLMGARGSIRKGDTA